MICPDCQSTKINKNGLKRGKQNHICLACRRQFIDVYSDRGYPQEVKKHCLHLYLEGNGFRRIERLTGVSHIAILNQLPTNRASLIMIKLVLIQPFQQKNYTYITWKNQKLDNELPA
jgi:hypothetical protein